MSRPAHPAAARMRVFAREGVNGRDMAEPDRLRTGVRSRAQWTTTWPTIPGWTVQE